MYIIPVRKVTLLFMQFDSLPYLSAMHTQHQCPSSSEKFCTVHSLYLVLEPSFLIICFPCRFASFSLPLPGFLK
jgi:hypothetical protein